jgi:hypothetical protein
MQAAFTVRLCRDLMNSPAGAVVVASPATRTAGCDLRDRCHYFTVTVTQSLTSETGIQNPVLGDEEFTTPFSVVKC